MLLLVNILSIGNYVKLKPTIYKMKNNFFWFVKVITDISSFCYASLKKSNSHDVTTNSHKWWIHNLIKRKQKYRTTNFSHVDFGIQVNRVTVSYKISSTFCAGLEMGIKIAIFCSRLEDKQTELSWPICLFNKRLKRLKIEQHLQNVLLKRF